jgi:hypothetical protein
MKSNGKTLLTQNSEQTQNPGGIKRKKIPLGRQQNGYLA